MGNVFSAITNPGTNPNAPVIQVSKENLYYAKAKKAKDAMTGWERIQVAFTRDQFGDISPEMYRIKDATFMSILVGSLVGATGRGRIAYQDFMRQNADTKFETPMQAKIKLGDKVTLGMGSGAFRIGWRLGAFTFMYMMGATLISTYRGKYGLIDQMGGAGLAGFLYKFKDGPKACFSGALFGSGIGLFVGGMTMGIIKLIGMDFERANLEYYARLDRKLDREKETVRRHREAATDERSGSNSLEKMHQELLASIAEAKPPKNNNKEESKPSKDQKSS